MGDSRQGHGAQTHRSQEAWQAPLGAEEPVAVQPAMTIHISLQHIHSHDTGVHGVWVLLHGGLDDRVPRVAAEETRPPVSGASPETHCLSETKGVSKPVTL